MPLSPPFVEQGCHDRAQHGRAGCRNKKGGPAKSEREEGNRQRQKDVEYGTRKRL